MFHKAFIIGRGGNASVRMLFDENGKQFAGKFVSKSDESAMDCLINEINILSKLDHPNVIKTCGINDTGKELTMVNPYYPLDLHRARYRHKLKSSTIRRYMKQIFSGLAYLHKNNIFHGDVKPANILVDHKGNLVLADFGAAGEFRETPAETTHVYAAPEVLGFDWDIWQAGNESIDSAPNELKSPGTSAPNESKNSTPTANESKNIPPEFNGKQDMWSAGCTLHFLLTCTHIFFGFSKDECLKSIEKSEVRVKDPITNDLLSKLLMIDPSKRLSADEALNHDYFNIMEHENNITK